MNKQFVFAQFDLDECLDMTDLVDPINREKAVGVLKRDPWNGMLPTLQEFLQTFFSDTWRIVSTTSIGDGRNIRYLMVKQNEKRI